MFIQTWDMNEGRGRVPATLLPNGQVLFAGVENGNHPLASAELGTYLPANEFSGSLTLPSGWVTINPTSISFEGTASDAALNAGSLSNDGSTWGSWVDATNGETVN